MTLKVGEVYRGMWCGDLCWFLITRIFLHDIKTAQVHYRMLSMSFPKFLVRFGERQEDSPQGFAHRLEHASRILNEKASYRSVEEVEVRYK